MKNFSKNIDDFYMNDYESIMNAGLVGKMWRYIHKSLDAPFLDLNRICLIEVGSGNGQHFNLSNISTREYVEVDMRKSDNSLVDLKKAKDFGRRFILDDATHLVKFTDSHFDGLIATCLLAHLPDIETTLNNWRRVVKPGGILSIYIPNEPGILLRIARGVTTKRRIQKRGYDHEFVHWKEHRNHFLGMRSMIKHVFQKDSIKFRGFPLPVLPWGLNLYTLVQITKTNDL
jgi:SAM-dependent methyltransferase